MKATKAFGADVELGPKKADVSPRRSKQFALIQPTTATRVDVNSCYLKDACPIRIAADQKTCGLRGPGGR